MIEAVVFDLDGVLVRSEEVWDEVREAYVRERGGRYDGEIQRAMMGMNDPNQLEAFAKSLALPAYFVLGAGSNILVGDGGIRGLLRREGPRLNGTPGHERVCKIG